MQLSLSLCISTYNISEVAGQQGIHRWLLQIIVKYLQYLQQILFSKLFLHLQLVQYVR